MIPELSIIKLLLNHDNFTKYGDLNAELLPKELRGVFRALQQWHREHGTDLSVSDLSNIFFSGNPPNREYFSGVFESLSSLDCSDQSCLVLLDGLRNRDALRKLALEAYEAAEGRKTISDILPLVELLKAPTNDSDASEEVFVTTDLSELIGKVYEARGLRWRLPSLNKALGSLRKGNFGFVFARPETGKTTFLASECSFMAEQLPDEAGPIIHFNNEEVGENVMLRYYQASAGCSTLDLMRYPQKYNEEFKARTKGKLLLVDDAGITKSKIERICEKYKPSLVVIDQIDKVEGFANDRDDLRLGAIYQWARELAKKYCPFIGITQADGSGEGQRWLTMGNVANAKTSKQAEADFILGIGRTNDMGFENLRFINISKNKLPGDDDSDPKERHAQIQCAIEPDIARYRDFGV